ncbi:hypothetical protein [Gaiella sp.]|uniref:hypothetical protein n=1 Tax=Gaiella sp. TaxID=2663207 RepID=UPI002E31F186|nr:hypothetical protein [Gaiella sp.]HEX5585286.1 hypothetical protein [Gaiella sp.]
MARVKSDVQRTIDRWLDYLLEAWQNLPKVEREIDNWDLIEQIDYVEEWTPKLDVANHLAELVASSEVTNEQRERYEQLQELMRRNRPILERLRAS